MEIVVEVLGTTNNVLERQRFTGVQVRIGRGYSNDLILSDEHADVAHAELHRDAEGQVWLRDLGSVNGTRRRKGNTPVTETLVASGDVFVIGRNRVRVFFADHALPPAVPLRPVESLLLWLGRAPVIAALFFIYLGATLANAYNRPFAEFEWSEFFGDQAMELLGFLALVAAVYLISVLFRRSGNFLSHLSMLLVVGLLGLAVDFALDVARFNGGNHSYELIAGADTASAQVLIFLYLWSVLYLAFNLSMRARSLISVAIVAIGILFTSLTRDEGSQRFLPQRFPEEPLFLRPALRVAQPISSGRYAEEIGEAFAAVDERRVERLEEREAIIGDDGSPEVEGPAAAAIEP